MGGVSGEAQIHFEAVLVLVLVLVLDVVLVLRIRRHLEKDPADLVAARFNG